MILLTPPAQPTFVTTSLYVNVLFPHGSVGNASDTNKPKPLLNINEMLFIVPFPPIVNVHVPPIGSPSKFCNCANPGNPNPANDNSKFTFAPSLKSVHNPVVLTTPSSSPITFNVGQPDRDCGHTNTEVPLGDVIVIISSNPPNSMSITMFTSVTTPAFGITPV